MDARRRDFSELAISGAIVALALFVFSELPSIPAEGGYSAVGPRFAPLIVGLGLLAIGLLLLRQALTGGWRDRGPPPEETMHAPSFAWIAGGLAVQMVVVGVAGFTVASTLLFVAVARGFGSTRIAHDAIVGLVLTAAVFVFFTRVLGLSLPASPLGIV
jgi:putative tricarboxylic transport membrane protein